MAEKLGLGPETRKLRLGESFSKNGHTAFHTFRYDFKPASMDTKKMATVQIGPNNQTTVQVPHVEGSGTSHTIFKGPRKPYTKECVLIIDNVTGEIVLEKLNSNVQLKKTRAEAGAKFQPRPMTPVEQTNSKKASPPQKHSPNNNLRPPHSPVQRTSPNQTSPYQRSPTSLSQKSPANQRSPSMPSLVPPTSAAKPNSFLSSMPLLAGDSGPPSGPPAVVVETAADEASEVGILSDSSNDSSSTGGSSSSSSESSDSESEKKDPVRKPPSSVENATSNSQYSSSNFPPSMPRFSQLSEDLHLSESESESDG